MEKENIEAFSGTVEDCTFRNEETGFTVLDISAEDGELVTVVGVLPDIAPGEEVRFYGRWDTHAKFGKQFRAESVERKMPETVAQMLKYLSSGAVKGIGPSTAEKIIEAFGEDTFRVLGENPERLSEIKGISKRKAEEISERFNEQYSVRESMIALEEYGLTPSEAMKVYGVFGSYSKDEIERNPYVLCSRKVGINFERVEAIAGRLPVRPDEAFRINAGIIHVLTHNLGNGHTCIPREKMLKPCSMLLGTDHDTIDIAMDGLVETGELKQAVLDGKEFVFLPEIYSAEMGSAEHIGQILKFPPAGAETLDRDIERLEKEQNIKYEAKQREAIVTAAEKGILVLTGGPGTGKTTTLAGILSLFEEQGLRVSLAAPTGRAAQRMSEITGREASTIHRLLEAERGPGGTTVFARNGHNTLETDAVIVDELSMVDIVLFSCLLDALPIGCRIVMVGDPDQLPPVGAGNVLEDIIDSGLLPVVKLDEVFRQAMESLIVSNAHLVVKGEMPVLDRVDNDFFHLERNDASSTASDIVSLYRDRLPKAYGYDSVRDIEILCPTKKGEVGSVNLNRTIQMKINPPSDDKAEITLKNRCFREGDKVMQTSNDYSLVWEKNGTEGNGIYNGDVGIIRKISRTSGIVEIDFDGRITEYPVEKLGDLDLAYAVTVHKSQGSEFEAVIMPVIDVPPQLCYRNLFYTAVTRARSKMITIGKYTQIEAMVGNNRKTGRYSALKDFLKEV